MFLYFCYTCLFLTAIEILIERITLKGHFDEKIVCLLLISVRHHSDIHLQDVFSFLLSCLAVEIFIF